jgi:hypothetical protein
MKSAKRLNRKLIKSRLTKKRRQVGCGVKQYTVNYQTSGQQHEFDLYVSLNDDDEAKSSVSVIGDPELLKETRLPTLDQLRVYAANFLPGGKYNYCPNTGLFVVREQHEQNVSFYKVNNKAMTQIIPDKLNIKIGVIDGDLSVNGIYITHIGINDVEPVLIPKEKINFSRGRQGAIKRRTKDAPAVTVNFNDHSAPVSSISPASESVFSHSQGPPLPPRPSTVRRPSSGSKRKTSSGSKRNSSTKRKSSAEVNNMGVPVNMESVYAKPSKNPPPLPPKKSGTGPYKGKGPSQFTK